MRARGRGSLALTRGGLDASAYGRFRRGHPPAVEAVTAAREGAIVVTYDGHLGLIRRVGVRILPAP